MRSLGRLRSNGAAWRHATREWFVPATQPPLTVSDRELEALAAQHQEISHTVRNILHVLAGVCLYCVIALGSPDANLVVSPTITIPILNYPVSFTAFLIVGPVLIGGLTLYLHVFYSSLPQLGLRLTSGGTAEPSARPPHIPKAAAVFNVDNWAGAALTWFLFYWVPPLVLGLFAWRAIPLKVVGPLCFCMAAVLALVMIALQIRRCRPQWRPWALPPLVVTSVLVAGMLASTMATGRVFVERRLNLLKADLSGKDLRDLDLRGAMLREAKLTGADLRRTLLSDADLRGATLQQATLTDVDFRDANLQGADFAGSKIDKAMVEPAKNWILANYDPSQLEELGLKENLAQSAEKKTLGSADLPVLGLDGVDLRDADLSGFNLRGVHFGKADLSGARLDDAQLQLADFREAKGVSIEQLRPGRCWFLSLLDPNKVVVPGYDINRVLNENLAGLDLTGLNLRGAVLAGFDLRATKLERADLRDAVFRGENQSAKAAETVGNLRGAETTSQQPQSGDWFRRANLERANLKGARIDPLGVKEASNWMLAIYSVDMALLLELQEHEERLRVRNFSGQNLSKGNFFAVDLSGWNLSGADLRGANLAGVKLKGAVLANAQVKGADLTKAILDCEELRQTTGWEDALRSANLLCETKASLPTATPPVQTPTPPVPTPTPDIRNARLKPHVNLVMLGQTGAGKTTLVSAITKVLARNDPAIKPREYESIHNAPQDPGRGLRLASSHVEFSTASRHYAVTDAPSHRDLMVLMVTGAAQADGGVLVVSAVDGVSSETREQLRMARLSGLSHVVVFLNKMDQVKDQRQAARVEGEVRELLSSNGFERDATPIISGSALGAMKLETRWLGAVNQLLSALDGHVPIPGRDVDRPFLMPVEDVFSITGRGTVVTGRVERGRIRVGEMVDILGFTSKTGVTILSVEMFRKLLDEGVAGDNVGLVVESGLRQEIERGQVLSAPGSMKAAKRFRAEVYLLNGEEGGRRTSVFSGYRPQFYLRTTDVTGTVRLEGAEIAQPGGFVTMEVELLREVLLEKGTRFSIREGGRTVGAGFVTQVLP